MPPVTVVFVNDAGPDVVVRPAQVPLLGPTPPNVRPEQAEVSRPTAETTGILDFTSGPQAPAPSSRLPDARAGRLAATRRPKARPVRRRSRA